jgi:hypothetical protein
MKACLKPSAALLFLTAVVAVLVLSTPAFAQCSMCRAALAGSNNALLIRNFNIGVLVLLVPPVTIFCSIFVALRRYKAVDSLESRVESTETVESMESRVESTDSRPETLDS